MNKHALAVTLVLAATTIVAAQPAAQPEAPKKKFDFKLDGFERTPNLQAGKIKLATGQATKDADRFFVEKLDILSPVAVTVLTKDPSHDIKVQLGKFDWNKNFDREGSTKGKTSLTFKLRTQGDIKILVSSSDPEPRPYQLAVWVGDPLKPKMEPLVVKKSAYRAPAGGARPSAGGDASQDKGGGNSGIIIAIVLIVVMIVTTMIVLNRRKR